MQSPSDAELLADYATRCSEAAFARLVERYVALVHSAARRQLGDPHLAEEITQAVFILLARKAGSLCEQTVLAGWLCRAAHFAARDALRAERRRLHREQLAATMDTPTDAAWQQLAPLLDEAVAQLREADRNAIVLRYYEQRPLDEVGAALGIGADAAQKRVARALEKLRAIFTQRGVTLTGAAIAGAVSANAIQAVPVGLAAKISATAIVAGATFTSTTAIVMTTLQKSIIGATLAAAVGTGIYEARQASQARVEVETLKQQQAPLTEQIEQLSREREQATNLVAGLREEVERLNGNTSELSRLRAEVGTLRQRVTEAMQRDRETAPDSDRVQKLTVGATIPRENWKDAGQASAEAVLQTYWWAALQGNVERLKECLTFGALTNPVTSEVASREVGELTRRLRAQNHEKLDAMRLDSIVCSSPTIADATIQWLHRPTDQEREVEPASAWWSSATDKLRLLADNGLWRIWVAPPPPGFLGMPIGDPDEAARMWSQISPELLQREDVRAQISPEALQLILQLQAEKQK